MLAYLVCSPLPEKRGDQTFIRDGMESLHLQWDSSQVKLSQGLKEFRFDHSGRPVALTINGNLFRRGLDGTVLCIRRYEEAGERFHSVARLEGKQRDRLLFKVRQEILDLRPVLGENFQRISPAVQIDLPQDARTFSQLYGRVGILPPESYRCLLLNLTRGCSYNKCSFCNFFKEQKYMLRTGPDFRRHIEEVKAAFGPSLEARRGIFIGQANAGNVPQEALSSALFAIREAFPCSFTDASGKPRHPLEFERVSCFLDTFSRSRRTAKQWSHLRQLGLDTLFLGAESGSPRVLKLLRKPGHPRLLISLVQKLKQAGIKVNVIIMTGVGGKEMASEHVESTAALLNSLPLSESDRIQFSAFMPNEDSEYSHRADAQKLTPLTPLECRLQKKQICSLLKGGKGPTRSLYDVNQFVY